MLCAVVSLTILCNAFIVSKAAITTGSKYTYEFGTIYCTSESVTRKECTQDINFDTAYTGTYRIRISVSGSYSQPTNCRAWVEWRLIIAGQEYVPFSSTPSAAFFDVTVSDAQFDSMGLQCTYNVIGKTDVETNTTVSATASTVTGTIDGFSIGKLAQSSTVVVRDNEGNQLQEEANEIAQKGNELQEEENKLQEESNKLQEEENKLQEESNKIQQGIFDKIAEFFGSFFENIINALKSLFIPEDGYFEDFFSRLNDFFSEKLGVLYVPIDIFVELMSGLMDKKYASGWLYFPGVKWGDVYIIPPFSENPINAGGADIPDLFENVQFATSVVMIGWVIHLLQVKLKEVLTK